MEKFWVTIFDDVYARSMRGESMTLTELSELILDTTASSKSELPLLKLARFGTVRSADRSLRHDGNVIAVTGAEGDYDRGEMPLSEAQRRLADANIQCLLYTTPSNAIAGPRWRILVPFSHELPPARRSKMVDRLNGVLGGVLSRESWTLSQAFYFGRVI